MIESRTGLQQCRLFLRLPKQAQMRYQMHKSQIEPPYVAKDGIWEFLQSLILCMPALYATRCKLTKKFSDGLKAV
ncbi:hypothetical protein BWD08_00550 [Neisseria animaloris]|nr:hypothetical protein BWD08_00550 [Neisseria animaloris]